MPTIVSDLIHSSFRLIGAVVAGEILETNELNDAFISLNQLISSWNTEGLSLAGRMRQVIALGGGNSYSLFSRPAKIDAASVSSGGIDSELTIVDAAGWEKVPEKSAQSVYVRVLYCDYLYPNSTVYIAPIPRLGGTLELWTFAPIAPFAALGDTIDLPPGYEQALRYNFALALLPEYPRSQVDASLPALAQSFKGSIVQLNASNHARSAPPVPAQGVS